MITRIRDVRKAKGMTLDDVARRCTPVTTAQTIGRLETGTRTVSVKWLNRIANALDVAASDLIELPESDMIAVAALLGQDGATAPGRPMTLVPPTVPPGAVGICVTSSIGDYRAGDELWCMRIAPDAFGSALNRDILVPRPAGRFVFARLIDRDRDTLHLLPLGAGQRQIVVTNVPWLVLPVRLVRGL